MFDKAKLTIKEDVCMKFYDEMKPLFIEKDVSGVGLGAALLQTKSNNSSPRGEAPEQQYMQTHCIHQQKPDWSRKKIQQYRNRSIRHIIRAGEITPLLLHERGEYNFKSQTNSYNIQKRYSKLITETKMNPAENTSIQGENHIHTWTRSIHSRPATQTNSQ